MKIVVHGTNWIGDAVMSVPALRALRGLFPEAEITLYTRRWAEGIFRDSEFIDRIISPPEGTRSIVQESNVWKAESFDLAILFTNSFSTALIANLGKVPKRFGFSGQWRKRLLTNGIRIPDWKNKKHEVFYYLELIAEVEKSVLGTETVGKLSPDFRLDVSDSRRTEARKTLNEHGIKNEGVVVGFGVGSQNSAAKRWPAKSFSELNDRLKKELGADVILLGSKEEIDVATQVREGSEFPPVNLTAKTGLDEAVAILAEIDLFVSNDMGLSHLASALGTKTLTIFGPTNPLTTHPFNGEVLRRDDVDCSPCMLRECPIDHRCMTRIMPDHVAKKVESMLGNI